MNSVLGRLRAGVPFAVLWQGKLGGVEERGDKAGEKDPHYIFFVYKTVWGKQSLNFSELTS